VNKTVGLVVALVVIVGSAAWLFSFYSSQPAPGEPVAHKAPIKCTACGKVYIGMIGRQPAKCAYCGEEAAWQAVKCAKCGEIFALVGAQSSFASAQSIKCPKCGCTSFKEVPPDGLEEK
jgi:DNA-directed RNA polymerase subunit RPC12/RpoP